MTTNFFRTTRTTSTTKTSGKCVLFASLIISLRNDFLDQFSFFVGRTSDAMFLFAHFSEKYSKILWRSGYITCPSLDDNACLSSGSADSCQCSCHEDLYDADRLPSILFETGVLNDLVFYDSDFLHAAIYSFYDPQALEVYKSLPGYTAEQSEKIYGKVRDFICDVGRIGDMFQVKGEI